MRIRNQFILSTVIFVTVLLMVAVSLIVTGQQIAQLDLQQSISTSVERGADQLNTLFSQYFLYQEPQQLTLWHSNYSSMLDNLSNLNPTNPEQQNLVNTAKDDLGRLNEGFNELASYLETAPRNVSVRILPEFQNAWNRTVSEHQTFGLDASRLSDSIRLKANQLRMTNTALIVALLGIFGAFFLTNYLITYRRTLKSVSKLQAGINIIGSGNLDFSIYDKANNEIGELSSSFNQMLTKLKGLTASKKELENEIAERRKVEEKLVENEQRLNRSQEIANLGSWELDLVKDRLSWSDEVYRIFGLKPQEFGATYEAFLEAVHPDDRGAVDDAYAGSLREGKDSYEIEHRVVRKATGEIRFVYEKCQHVRDETGKIIRSIGMVQDITERKVMEAQLQVYRKHLEDLVEERTKQLKDAERLATIGATAGMVGHDIRNPLQAITSDVYLAKTDLAAMPDCEGKQGVQESLEEIEKNTLYINKIVVDLQDFARPISPKLEEIDLEQTIHSALAHLNIPGNVTVKHSIKKGFPKLNTDPVYLQRILTNLANNAIQAMPKGGMLAINATTKNGKAVITVEDTGEGIPESVRDKLFTPLVTTKSKGQGFGLSVVKRFTEGLGGTVTFESEVGKGTKFIIELPIRLT